MGIFGHDADAPRYGAQDKAKAEALFREAGYWDNGFSVSVITEEANLFADAALVLKDSIEGLNPNFRINVLAVAEAVLMKHTHKILWSMQCGLKMLTLLQTLTHT